MGLLSRGALLIVVVGIGAAGLLRFQQPAEPKPVSFEEMRPGLYRHSLNVFPLPQVFQVRRSLQQHLDFDCTAHTLAHLNAAVFPAAGGNLALAGS